VDKGNPSAGRRVDSGMDVCLVELRHLRVRDAGGAVILEL
jgi:hypothetical protein